MTGLEWLVLPGIMLSVTIAAAVIEYKERRRDD